MLLSIITINLNNLEGLKRTTDSILSQSDNNFEWIVIDGGSNDGSYEYIASKSDKLAFWISEPDSGVYDAMNKGIRNSKGDYCIFMNSGDCFHDVDVVRDFHKFIDIHGDFGLIYGDTAIALDNKIIDHHFPTDNLSLFYLKSHHLYHQSIFFKSELFDKAIYGETYKICADRALILKFLLEGASFCKFDRLISIYDNEGMSSTNTEKTLTEFNKSFDDIVPPIIKSDLNVEDEKYTLEQIDLQIYIKDIIFSNRFVRNFTRLLIYPLHAFVKRANMVKNRIE